MRARFVATCAGLSSAFVQYLFCAAPPQNSDLPGSLSQPEVLKAESAEALDHTTTLAGSIFEVASVTLNLVAEEREWFNAASRVDSEHGTASRAFVLLDADLLLVEDATGHDWFADHPLVDPAEAPRFFASAPLVVDDGHRVGALCLTDDQPRPFDERDRSIPSLLADVAADTLETRHRARQIDCLISVLEAVGFSTSKSVTFSSGKVGVTSRGYPF